MRRILPTLLLAACTTPEPQPTGLWGSATLPDMDPADDVVEVHLVASKTQMNWGGARTKGVWAYNGVVPGPILEARVGQTLVVQFTNDLPEETTVHWHGLRVSDDMDGVPAIQEPVKPGGSFTYTLPLADAGTYWYHPHVRSHEQTERGLHGTIVVHERDEPPVARDRVFVLDDVALDEEGDFSTFTIGHGTSVHGRYGNVLLANGQNILEEPLSDSVRPDAPERWRLVNVSNARTHVVDLPGVRARVVAVDGLILEEAWPVKDTLTIPVGRRFDLDVIARSSSSQVKLRSLVETATGTQTFPIFEGTVDGEAGDGAWPVRGAPSMPTETEADQQVELLFDAYAEGDLATWTINGDIWSDHDPIRVGAKPTRIRIVDATGSPHPFHLHGQFFKVLERSGRRVEPGGWRDTILVDPDEEVLLWSPFDNPGRWMAHCHILEHAERGMMTELVLE